MNPFAPFYLFELALEALGELLHLRKPKPKRSRLSNILFYVWYYAFPVIGLALVLGIIWSLYFKKP